VKRLSAKPGKPGTYRVVLAKAGPYAGKLAIDLGFSNYYLPPGKFSFKEWDIVTLGEAGSLQGGGAAGDLYTYRAYVFDVLDGDTVNAVVDLGFGIVTTQKLRFRGVDAPEIMTRDGMESKNALQRMIGKVSPLLIKTVKSDKYDRYLADVFIDHRLQAEDQRQGTKNKESEAAGLVYLNQKLVDDGLAEIVEE
jgi:micrococcal nuclease